LTTEGKTEEIARVSDAKAERKTRRLKKKEYLDKAEDNRLPMCNACFTRDYPNLHNWEFYTEMKPVKDRKWKGRDTRSPLYGKITGLHRDYVCTHTFEVKGKKVKCPGKTSRWVAADELKQEKKKIK